MKMGCIVRSLDGIQLLESHILTEPANPTCNRHGRAGLDGKQSSDCMVRVAPTSEAELGREGSSPQHRAGSISQRDPMCVSRRGHTTIIQQRS